MLRVRTGLKLIDKQWVRLDTKTHQQRRIALDDSAPPAKPPNSDGGGEERS